MTDEIHVSNQYAALVDSQRRYFRTNTTLSYSFRIQQLKKLLDIVNQNEDKILAALKTDLNKSKFEAWGVEVGIIQTELQYAISHLHRWMKPVKLRTPYFHFYARSYTQKIPYGNTLVISPWNYPFQLALRPAIGAIAAGNTCIIKPSDVTPATSVLLGELINHNFPSEYLHVVNTDANGTQELLENKFDFIFFTGGTQIGKKVYEAAARNLTPVALELGGKNPCIIEADANMKITADRITWGKFSNAGQTCVAPDYLLVHESIQDELIKHIIQNIKDFFGDAILSPDYGRIINQNHMNRIGRLMQDVKVIYGGVVDDQNKFISPTLVEIHLLDEPIMQEEIFGPVLPVIPYKNIHEAFAIIARNPDPLVFYLFTHNRSLIKQVAEKTSSGDLVINEVVLHFGHLKLPIGGKGSSGIGKYQGKYSFDEFSHKKSVMHRSFFPDLSVRYPPYNDKKLKFLKRMFKWFMMR